MSRKSGWRGGQKNHAIRRGGGGGVDFFWNNPLNSRYLYTYVYKSWQVDDANTPNN